MAALKRHYRDLGAELWNVHGARDAYDPCQDWVSPIYTQLNRAPIVTMIENYWSGLVRKSFMSPAEIGLKDFEQAKRTYAQLAEEPGLSQLAFRIWKTPSGNE